MSRTQPFLNVTTTVASAIAGWNRFWFRPADSMTLCLIRVLCGTAIFMIHFAYCFDLQELVGPNAWVDAELANQTRLHIPVTVPPSGWDYPAPTAVVDDDQRQKAADYVQRWGVHPDMLQGQGTYSWTVWYHLSDSTAMACVHGFILMVMFCFAIGLATRLTSALSLIGALQYIHRAQPNLFGMDQMVIILLLYLTIGDCGAELSVDRWLARRGWSWSRLFGGAATPTEAQPSVSSNLALRLLQVHMCFIYAAAGLAKLLGSTWWNGTALWGAVSNYEFTWFWNSTYAAGLQWLCGHRLIWELSMTFAAAYTIVLQVSFPYLIWQRRWRWLLVCGSILLHTMISALMGLLGFGLCMIAMVLAYIPGEAVRAVLMPAAKNQHGSIIAQTTTLAEAA